MKVSELIQQLQKVLNENGDIIVEARNGAGDFDTIEDIAVEADSFNQSNTKYTAYIT
jgi:hypothetical protein